MQSSRNEVTALYDVGQRALVDRIGFRFFKEFSSRWKGSSLGFLGGSAEVIGSGQSLQQRKVYVTVCESARQSSVASRARFLSDIESGRKMMSDQKAHLPDEER